jgi:transposase
MASPLPWRGGREVTEVVSWQELSHSDKMMLWRVLFRFFKENKEEFYKHYHLRSNVESVFSMIKRKFGGFVRARSDLGRENEILCKALCHNICVLIQEIFELGITVDFQETSSEFMCKIEL